MPCGEGAPGLSAAVRGWLPGKPPLDEVQLDLVVHNPRSRPVWFLFDYMIHNSPPLINQVAVRDLSGAVPAYVWELSGIDYTRAVRIAARSQLELDDVLVTIFRQEKHVRFAFADGLDVDGTPAEIWVGADGITGSGRVRVAEDWSARTVRTRRGAVESVDLGAVGLSFDLICTQSLRVRND
jgi:hypothetical protein